VATVSGTTPVTFGARLAVNGIWNAAALVVLNVEMGAIQWMMGAAAWGTLEGRVWPWPFTLSCPTERPKVRPGHWQRGGEFHSGILRKASILLGDANPPNRPYALV
jgi:hypothetical protein